MIANLGIPENVFRTQYMADFHAGNINRFLSDEQIANLRSAARTPNFAGPVTARTVNFGRRSGMTHAIAEESLRRLTAQVQEAIDVIRHSTSERIVIDSISQPPFDDALRPSRLAILQKGGVKL